MFLATCFKYCIRGLPTASFPDIAPSRMFTTNSLCLTVCPIYERCQFFNIFKSNLSSFALLKTSSFDILSVHFISNILLQLYVSNAFKTLSSFFPMVPVSDPQTTTLQTQIFVIFFIPKLRLSEQSSRSILHNTKQSLISVLCATCRVKVTNTNISIKR